MNGRRAEPRGPAVRPACRRGRLFESNRPAWERRRPICPGINHFPDPLPVSRRRAQESPGESNLVQVQIPKSGMIVIRESYRRSLSVSSGSHAFVEAVSSARPVTEKDLGWIPRTPNHLAVSRRRSEGTRPALDRGGLRCGAFTEQQQVRWADGMTAG